MKMAEHIRALMRGPKVRTRRQRRATCTETLEQRELLSAANDAPDAAADQQATESESNEGPQKSDLVGGVLDRDQIGVRRGGRWYLDGNGDADWGGILSGDIFHEYGFESDTALAGDWDGNGLDEIGIHRFTVKNGKTESRFYLDANRNGQWDGRGAGNDIYVSFGIAGDKPIVGDWNGDGTDEVGVHRFSVVNGRTESRFYLDANGNGKWDGTGAGQDRFIRFGIANDTAVIGDWNGDGKDQIGVQRFHSVGGLVQSRWYLDANDDGLWSGLGLGNDTYMNYGEAGDTAIAGDWDGDGRDEIGVMRFAVNSRGNTEARFYLDASGDGQYGVGDLFMRFGIENDVPVIGDWRDVL